MYIVETCPECGRDLSNEVICNYPPIHRKICYYCGWHWEKQEEIKRVPFQPDITNKCSQLKTYNMDTN